MDFEQYIIQGEPGRKERAENWQVAIGLQAVDGLRPSRYLLQTAQEHIEERISMDEVERRIADPRSTEKYGENREKFGGNAIKKGEKTKKFGENTRHDFGKCEHHHRTDGSQIGHHHESCRKTAVEPESPRPPLPQRTRQRRALGSD